MKITKRQLRRIIREEKVKLMEQPDIPDVMGAIGHGKPPSREEFQGAMLDLDDYNKLTRHVEKIISDMTWAAPDAVGYTREDIIEALKSIIEEI